eukprot:m.237925 g.237925  ORF g.237925 m.237925 type:complete len:786 (-) comp18961_c1_seq6:65-2422(-)
MTSGVCSATDKSTFHLTAVNSSACLAVASDGTIATKPCTGSDAQQLFRFLGDGTVQNVATSRCVAVTKAAGPACLLPIANNSAWCDSTKPLADRVAALIKALQPDEKAGLFTNSNNGVPRLGWPKYNWWSEALHGVARDGMATSWPQVIGVGASYNKSLFWQLGDLTSTEARGKSGGQGKTYWAPNINIFRDPRWGRGQETPGEDPVLTSAYAEQFVTAMQGPDPEHLKVSACLKHYAAYSQETDRNSFPAVVEAQDMTDTYLPAFQAGVEKAKASGIMCSYNAETYGNGIYGKGTQGGAIPSCANQYLMNDLARKQWSFDGYITSDCGAVGNVQNQHKYTQKSDDTLNAVLQAGMDIDCGGFMKNVVIMNALKDGSLKESLLDEALTHLFSVQIRLGMADSPDDAPYTNYSQSDVNTPAHQAVAKQAADQSLVLLKNTPSSLPLKPSEVPTVAVIGKNANATRTMQGNYYGTAPFLISPLDGIATYAKTVYADGSSVPKAVSAAQQAQAVVLVIGLTDSDEHEGHDRSDLILPDNQDDLVAQVTAAAAKDSKPVVVVVMSGSAVDITAIKNNTDVHSIMWCGYPGQAGGQAIADALFGTTNHFGKLPMTWYPNNYTKQVTLEEYAMRPNTTTGYPGRTHRFYKGPTVYPFGYGLSYTQFSTRLLPSSRSFVASRAIELGGAASVFEVDCEVANTGPRDGDQVVLLFASPPDAGTDGRPLQQLMAFDRVSIPLNQTSMIKLAVPADQFALAQRDGTRQVAEGRWTLWVGPESQDKAQTMVNINIA